MNTSSIRSRLLALAALNLTVAAGCGSDAAGPGDGADEGSGGAMSTGTMPDEDDGDSTGAEPPPPPTDDPTGDEPSGDASDGGTGDEPDDTTAGDSSGDSGATVAPTIVELIPADGTTGVTSDAQIVIRFSEPMDMASVQQAFQSADIPAAEVTFEWNAAGDELTVIPNEALPYAFGYSPTTVSANEFAYTITTVAESAEGVPLEAPVAASFSTLRRISQHMERDDALSSQMRNDGFMGLQPYIGDFTLDNATRRYLLTFDLSDVPAVLHTIEQAEFSAAWQSDVGDPWISMGGVLYQQVGYDALTPAAFDAPNYTSNYALFASQNNYVSIDVSDELQAVVADPATFDQRLQFRLRWAIENNFDMDNDGLYLAENLLELDLQYLTP